MDISLSIRGLQEVQANNLRRIAMLQPTGQFGQVIRDITAYAHRQAVIVTHVITGSLRASHRMEIEITNVARGQVFIDPAAINPRTRQRPVDYGPIEHARGGSHAFYTRAMQPTEIYARGKIKEFGAMITR